MWIGGFGFGTLAVWLNVLHEKNGNPPEAWMKWLFLFFCLTGTAFIFWYSRRLKRIQIDDDYLYVSNYFSEIRIPLIEVSHSTYQMWWSPSTVAIHLHNMTVFGQRIVFIPKTRLAFFYTHPVVSEIQTLSDRAKERVKGTRLQ